jgi:hypothetical protein
MPNCILFLSTLFVHHNHVNAYAEASKCNNMSLHAFILLDIDTYRLITSKKWESG